MLEFIVEVILADLSAGIGQLVWLVLHEWRDLLVCEPIVFEQFRIRLGILAFLSLLKCLFFASDLVDVFRLNKASVVVVEAVFVVVDPVFVVVEIVFVVVDPINVEVDPVFVVVVVILVGVIFVVVDDFI